MLIDRMPDRIIRYPDPVLRRRCVPIETFDTSVAELARLMLRIMKESNGVGLAAPQVGLSIRLFVANPSGEPADDHVFINPELSDLIGGVVGEEGCLSLPEIHVSVRRARRCDVAAQDVNGDQIQMVCEDLMARIVQHETDHLEGRLIIDCMDGPDRIANRKAITQLEKEYKT